MSSGFRFGDKSQSIVKQSMARVIIMSKICIVKTQLLIIDGAIPGDVHEQGGEHAGHDVHQTAVTLVLNLKSGVKVFI